MLAERASNVTPYSSLVATVPVRHRSTLYARFGDWFGWLNIGLLIVLAVGARMVARKNR